MEKQLIPEIPSMLQKDQTNALLNTKLDLDISVCNDEWAGNISLKENGDKNIQQSNYNKQNSLACWPILNELNEKRICFKAYCL